MSAELNWYYGPVSWNKDAGSMWHRDCPQEPDSEVLVFKDGSYLCACGEGQEAPEEEQEPEEVVTDPWAEVRGPQEVTGS